MEVIHQIIDSFSQVIVDIKVFKREEKEEDQLIIEGAHNVFDKISLYRVQKYTNKKNASSDYFTRLEYISKKHKVEEIESFYTKHISIMHRLRMYRNDVVHDNKIGKKSPNHIPLKQIIKLTYQHLIEFLESEIGLSIPEYLEYYDINKPARLREFLNNNVDFSKSSLKIEPSKHNSNSKDGNNHNSSNTQSKGFSAQKKKVKPFKKHAESQKPHNKINYQENVDSASKHQSVEEVKDYSNSRETEFPYEEFKSKTSDSSSVDTIQSKDIPTDNTTPIESTNFDKAEKIKNYNSSIHIDGVPKKSSSQSHKSEKTPIGKSSKDVVKETFGGKSTIDVEEFEELTSKQKEFTKGNNLKEDNNKSSWDKRLSETQLKLAFLEISIEKAKQTLSELGIHIHKDFHDSITQEQYFALLKHFKKLDGLTLYWVAVGVNAPLSLVIKVSADNYGLFISNEEKTKISEDLFKKLLNDDILMNSSSYPRLIEQARAEKRRRGPEYESGFSKLWSFFKMLIFSFVWFVVITLIIAWILRIFNLY